MKQLKMDHRPKSIKLLESNRGENLVDLEFGNKIWSHMDQTIL
jgi:hypothetical protein